MSCFASDIYKHGQFLVSGIDSKKFVYILPKGTSVKSAIRELILEHFERQTPKSFDIKEFYEYAKDADFASEEIAYTRRGKQYHKWIKNPYMFCNSKERRKFVDDVIKDYKASKRLATKIKELPILVDLL